MFSLETINTELSTLNSNFHKFSLSLNPKSQMSFSSSFSSFSHEPNQSAAFFSSVEAAVLRSADPIEITQTEEISVLGQRGIWVNQQEASDWPGNSGLKNTLAETATELLALNRPSPAE